MGISDYYLNYSTSREGIEYQQLVQYSVKHFIQMNSYNWQIILESDSYMALTVGQECVLYTFTG